MDVADHVVEMVLVVVTLAVVVVGHFSVVVHIVVAIIAAGIIAVLLAVVDGTMIGVHSLLLEEQILYFQLKKHF